MLARPLRVRPSASGPDVPSPQREQTAGADRHQRRAARFRNHCQAEADAAVLARGRFIIWRRRLQVRRNSHQKTPHDSLGTAQTCLPRSIATHHLPCRTSQTDPVSQRTHRPASNNLLGRSSRHVKIGVVCPHRHIVVASSPLKISDFMPPSPGPSAGCRKMSAAHRGPSTRAKSVLRRTTSWK